MQRRILITLTGVCLLAVALPVFAHHAFTGNATPKKPLKLRGTVAKVELIDPHSWIHIDVKNPDGTDHPLDDRGWHSEHPASARLHEKFTSGRHRDSGGRVSGKAATGSNREDGRDLTFPDGKKIFLVGLVLRIAFRRREAVETVKADKPRIERI